MAWTEEKSQIVVDLARRLQRLGILNDVDEK
jgi:hypothetical protein